MNNYILEYYQKIVSGEIIVGKWVRMLYDRIVSDLENGVYFYDAKKAKRCLTFIENYCHHVEGSLAPQTIKLELWQKAFLSLVFGIVDEDGTRHFREVFLITGRKNGKTLLEAAISAYMLYLDDYGSRVYFVAPKLQQAQLCFSALQRMVEQEPDLSKITKKRRSDLYVDETNSTACPLAFSSKKSDGLNISFCVCDELSSWEGDRGLKFYEVLKSSQGSRKQPLLMSISTGGYVNNGIFDELFKRSTNVLMHKSSESRLLPVLYMIDDVTLWDDINELRKANPNLGVSISVNYLLDEAEIANTSMSKKAEFICKYCNLKMNASTAWLESDVVECACIDDLTLEQFRGCYCVVGVDLSQTTDLTSCVVLIEYNGVLYAISKCWMPSNTLEEHIETDNLPYRIYMEQDLMSLSGESFVDYKDCYNFICSLISDFELYPLKIGYDRYSSQYLISDLKAAGFHCDDVYQGTNLHSVILETEGLLKDRKMKINGDLAKVHLLDTAVKVNDDKNRRCQIVKVANNTHIDITAALLDAMCMRSKYAQEIGEQLKNNDKGE